MKLTLIKAQPQSVSIPELIAQATAAGDAAVQALQVRPMVVAQHASPLDDASPVVKTWLVEGGPCGFAWVSLKGLRGGGIRSAFLGAGFKKDSYEGGLKLWISGFGQSVQKKEAYANAFANVLRAAGFRAYADSRLD